MAELEARRRRRRTSGAAAEPAAVGGEQEEAKDGNTDATDAAAGPTAPTEEPGRLVFETSSKLKFQALGVFSVVQFGFWGNVAWTQFRDPTAIDLAAWWTWLGSGLAVACALTAQLVATHTVREIWLTRMGTHARITTFNVLGGSSAPVEVPIGIISHGSNNKGMMHIKIGDAKSNLLVDLGGSVNVVDEDAFDNIVNGRVVLSERLRHGKPATRTQRPGAAVGDATGEEEADEQGQAPGEGSAAPGSYKPGDYKRASPARPAGARTAGGVSVDVDELELYEWVPAKDPKTGNTYYYHPVTREVSWEKPASRVGGGDDA